MTFMCRGISTDFNQFGGIRHRGPVDAVTFTVLIVFEDAGMLAGHGFPIPDASAPDASAPQGGF